MDFNDVLAKVYVSWALLLIGVSLIVEGASRNSSLIVISGALFLYLREIVLEAQKKK